MEEQQKVRERLIALEVNSKNQMDKLEEIKKDNIKAHDEIKESMEKGFNDIKVSIEEGLRKKSDKWVQVGFVWFLGIFATGVLGYIGNILIKTINHLTTLN